MSDTHLDRSIGSWFLGVFVVGNVLGAGIYAIVGEVAADTGGAVWLAFAVAGVLVSITAMSYIELVTKYERAGGGALFVAKAFRNPAITVMVAVGVVAAAVTSAAASAVAFAGQYLDDLVELPQTPVAIAFVVALSLVNWWGVSESMKINLVLTGIIVVGLLVVAALGLVAVIDGSGDLGRAFEFKSGTAWPLALLGGTALSFFAFVGFEDTAQVAEETRDVDKSYPRALIGGLLVATVIYIAVTMAAVVIVDPAEHAESNGPQLQVVENGPFPVPSRVFSAIALIALANTALLNLVASSRMLYGMAEQGVLPRSLGAVSPARGTPALAIVVVGTLALGLAATGNLGELADTTVALLLVVFAITNSSVLKLRHDEVDGEYRKTPRALPVVGAVTSAGLAGYTLVDGGVPVVLRFGALLMLGVAVYVVQRLVAGRTDELDPEALSG
jgi:amino acid transporter